MKRRALMLALLFLAPAVSRAEPYRQFLISASRNVDIANKDFKSQEITPGSPVKWTVQKVTLHGGKAEGVEAIVVNNGKLRFTIVPTRGMGIYRVHMGDVQLGWNSPVKEFVHPTFINLQSRGGLGWLEGFNEWMCRCGLENNGQPGTDKFINNTGDEATMELTLHGKIANLPAEEVELSVDREPPYRITIRGRVYERMFYGPKLELRTEISTEPGATTLRVSDIITNQGAQPQEFQLLYHVNQGKPILQEGASLVAPVKQVTPFNDNAAKSIDNYATYSGPTLGFIEQVYCFRLFGDRDDRTLVMLQNRSKDRAWSMTYSLKELPYFTLWKNTAAEKDGYVTGLEPGTNFPNNRRVERQFGRVPKLESAASYRATIEYGIHVGADSVQKVADRIAAIQGDRKPTVDAKPVPVTAGK